MLLSPGNLVAMEVENVGGGGGESLIFTSDAKLDFSGNGNELLAMHTNGIKTEDANLLAQALQSVSSMVTLTPDAALSTSGVPLGTVLSMAAPGSSGMLEQVLFTLQPVGNNILDLVDDGKPELAHASIANVAAGGGASQLLNGNLQTMLSLQGLQGYGGAPQIATLGIPSAPSLGTLGHLTNGNGALTVRTPVLAHAANGATAQITPMAVPQSIGIPQFIMAGGQLVQSFQGTQLLIPSTPSSMPTQQILTVPINQPNSGQVVQMMMPNGQLVTATLGSQQPTAVASANSLQPPTLVTNSVPSVNIPQIITNSSGQILAVSPQLIGQSGFVQLYGPGGQIQSEKQQVLQANVNSALSKQVGFSTGPSTPMISPPAQVQMSSVSDSAQVVGQPIQRTVSTPTQLVQVAQTSSPSITSTESSTPISQTSANTVDGINLEEIKEFAKAFKIRRLSLGLTQTQVGQALSITEGPAYSQSAICRFEKLDITPKSAQKIKPVLERWMKEAEERYKNGAQNLTDFIGAEPSKKRKRRTSFTPQALEVLGHHFDRNTHPSGAEMTDLAGKLNYDREVVRVWFCNKRQTLKNTIRKLKSAAQ